MIPFHHAPILTIYFIIIAQKDGFSTKKARDNVSRTSRAFQRVFDSPKTAGALRKLHDRTLAFYRHCVGMNVLGLGLAAERTSSVDRSA